MLKHLKLALIALSTALLFAACDETEPDHWGTLTPVADEAIVVNQGNMYGGIAGTLSSIDLKSGGITNNVFQSANNQSLGDTPQNAVYHGSKLYIAVFGSNLVWVLDAKSKQILQQVETSSPEWVEAGGDYVYVANNDGNVTRIDTLNYTTQTIEVGPNPACMTISGDYLYVSISDGYNYENGYVNGKKVAKVNLNTFTKETDIPVGLNPGKIVSDRNGNIFVVCLGDYYTIPSQVYHIAADATTSTALCEGSQIACNTKTNVLYVLNTSTDWATGESATTYTIYSTTTLAEQTNVFSQNTDLPASPTGIFVNEVNDHVYITADRSTTGYDKQGDVYEFDSTGLYVNKYAAGIHPYAVAFRYTWEETY